MGTWPEYLKNSLGMKIFFGVCLLLTVNIMISAMIEKKRLKAGVRKDEQKIKSINTLKRLWIGMLAGFITTVIVGVAQFIIRFGYFTLMQEIGAVFFGFIGAVVGGVCGIIKWGHKSAKAQQSAAGRSR